MLVGLAWWLRVTRGLRDAWVILESCSAPASLWFWPWLLLRPEKMKPNGVLENLPDSKGDAV